MDDPQRRAELAQRLSDAGAAHGRYEMTALHGEYDPQWAEWYARYLTSHGWNEFFSSAWDNAELAAALRQADSDQRAYAPQSRWQDFYAARFVETSDVSETSEV